MHRRGVVGGAGLVAADDEPAVLGLARQAVLEDDHRPDDLGALDVADVEALDAQRRLVELEGVLQLLERLAAGREVAGAGDLVPGQALLGVAGDGLHEGALVAAARHPQVDPAAAQPRTATRRGPRRRRGARARAPRGARRRRPRRRRPAGAGARRRRASSRRRARPPSRAGRGPGRRARGRAAPPPRARPRRGRTRRRRWRRAARPPTSRGPAPARRCRRAAGRRARSRARPRPPSSRAVSRPEEATGLAGHEVAEVLGDLAVPLRRRPGRRRARCTCRCSRAGRAGPTWPARLNTPAEQVRTGKTRSARSSVSRIAQAWA